VPLEEDDVPVGAVVTAEKVIERDFVQRGGRRERRDVSANALFRLVGADHHCRRVPPDDALDAAFEVRAARHQHLLVGRDGVDVGGVGGERDLDAVLRRVNRQLAQQPLHFDRTASLKHIIEGVEPFPQFDRVELRSISWSRVSHYSISSFYFFGTNS
jgi:hypothetical protein